MAEAFRQIIGTGLKTRREQFAAIHEATNLLVEDHGLPEDGRIEFNGHEGQHMHELSPGVPINVGAYYKPDENGATYGVSIYVPTDIEPEVIIRVLDGVPRDQWSQADWEAYEYCRKRLNIE